MLVLQVGGCVIWVAKGNLTVEECTHTTKTQCVLVAFGRIWSQAKGPAEALKLNFCSNLCLVKTIPTDATNSTSCVTAERLRMQEVAFDDRPMKMPSHIGGWKVGTVLVKPALQGWVVNTKHSLDVSWLWFVLWVLGPICQEGLYNLLIIVQDKPSSGVPCQPSHWYWQREKPVLWHRR